MGEGVAQDETPPLTMREGSSAPVLALCTFSCGGLSPQPFAMPILHGTQIARPGADGTRKACHFSGLTDIWAPQEASCVSAPRATLWEKPCCTRSSTTFSASVKVSYSPTKVFAIQLNPLYFCLVMFCGVQARNACLFTAQGDLLRLVRLHPAFADM